MSLQGQHCCLLEFLNYSTLQNSVDIYVGICLWSMCDVEAGTCFRAFLSTYALIYVGED